jgi:hypothetical protein
MIPMIPWIELIGYFALALVALTFYMRTMLPLRYCAIGSNVVFVLYAYYNNIYPHPAAAPVSVSPQRYEASADQAAGQGGG